MKNRIINILCILLLFVIVISDCNVSAKKTYSEGFFKYTVEDGSIAIRKYFGKDSEVTVPNMIAGIPVNIIKNGSFSNNESVEIIILPDTITQIEQGSFAANQKVEFVNNTVESKPKEDNSSESSAESSAERPDNILSIEDIAEKEASGSDDVTGSKVEEYDVEIDSSNNSGNNGSDTGSKIDGDNSGDTGSIIDGDNSGDTGSRIDGDNSGDTGSRIDGDNSGDTGSKIDGDNSGDTGSKIDGDNSGDTGSKIEDNTDGNNDYNRINENTNNSEDEMNDEDSKDNLSSEDNKKNSKTQFIVCVVLAIVVSIGVVVIFLHRRKQ